MSLEEGSGSTRIKKSLPSIFVKLIYCREGRLIERQELVRLAAPVLYTAIFFGCMVNLELHILLFDRMDFTFAWKNLSCVFGFPLCGQHKGLWDRMWEKGGCCLPKCMFGCLADSPWSLADVSGYINSMAHPFSLSFSLSLSLPLLSLIHKRKPLKNCYCRYPCSTCCGTMACLQHTQFQSPC